MQLGADERGRRQAMCSSLQDNGGSRGVRQALLRQLRIYGGARGIWVDKSRTAPLTSDGYGVTVGLLATEGAHPDLLCAAEGIYRYPEAQIHGWDHAGIAATKSVCRSELDIFPITRSASGPERRSVRLARVTGWDDHFSLVMKGASEKG